MQINEKNHIFYLHNNVQNLIFVSKTYKTWKPLSDAPVI